MKKITNISVIGLGKLGGSMAAAFAHRGFNVIGVDINPANVETFNAGKAPVQETGLSEMIAANKNRLRATHSTEEALMGSDISFVIVPTPSDHRGAFTLQYARHAFAELGKALKKKQAYHVIVMTSTVLPGSMRSGLLPILEKESGLRCGPDFGLCYNPEFIALGSVIRDFLNPDFYLLGQFDESSGDALESVHQKVSQNKAPVRRMSIENAELAKIAVNSFVTLKISFANMLAEFCERIPNGDVDVVSDALGMDKRIGRKYLTGGLSFAGPCFPRDNVAMAFVGQQLGVDTSILKANDKYNINYPNRLILDLKKELPEGCTVAVLGLSYKPLSHITEGSSGVTIVKELANLGYRVKAHDCLAINHARPNLENYSILTENLSEVLLDVDAILVTTTDEPYLKIKPTDLDLSRKVIIVDFWRALKHLKGIKNLKYIPYGYCKENETAKENLSKIWI